MPASDFLECPIEDDENISRFLTQKNHYRSSGRVHHSAFQLPRGEKTLSTYRTKGLDELDIWNIAKKYVTNLRSDHPDVKARADITALFYRQSGLRVVPKPDPHPRHVNIEGWPEEDARLELRIKLANNAELKLKK